MASRRKLDRKRPYGEIYGHLQARYEQFGILFDTEGNELPGFEDVKIPEAGPVVVIGDSKELEAALAELREENARLRDELEEKEALVEEIQGKLDTANIEIARLNAQIEELTKPADPQTGNSAAPVDAAPAAGKKKTEQPSLIDDQLKAQGA